MKGATCWAGISAGSLCWFEQGITDSIPGAFTPLAGLVLLSGSNCPFLNGSERKGKDYRSLIEDKQLAPGVATELGETLHFKNDVLVRAVNSSKGATARTFELTNGKVKVSEIPTDYLTL